MDTYYCYMEWNDKFNFNIPPINLRNIQVKRNIPKWNGGILRIFLQMSSRWAPW
jgi:hypothetical protein